MIAARLLRSIATSCVVVAAGAPSVCAEAAPPKPSPWEPLRFFVGSWTGEGSGQPGTSTLQRDYRFILRDRFLEARSTSMYLPQPKNPKGEVHEELGLFSWDRIQRRFLLRQFHVEGFVNHYLADSVRSGGDSLVFTTVSIENLPVGFRAREVYRIHGPDEFTERFEIAEPGKDFVVYSQARLRRKK
jgi:hypothetical protein